MFIGFFFSL
ncbi:hypothetical protein ECFDA505_5316, partial [Escherichia coli FDA505]